LRVDVSTAKLERLEEGWFGVSTDGTSLAARSLSSEEIWVLKRRLPEVGSLAVERYDAADRQWKNRFPASALLTRQKPQVLR
jgi:hypothetical protein